MIRPRALRGPDDLAAAQSYSSPWRPLWTVVISARRAGACSARGQHRGRLSQLLAADRARVASSAPGRLTCPAPRDAAANEPTISRVRRRIARHALGLHVTTAARQRRAAGVGEGDRGHGEVAAEPDRGGAPASPSLVDAAVPSRFDVLLCLHARAYGLQLGRYRDGRAEPHPGRERAHRPIAALRRSLPAANDPSLRAQRSESSRAVSEATLTSRADGL